MVDLTGDNFISKILNIIIIDIDICISQTSGFISYI